MIDDKRSYFQLFSRASVFFAAFALLGCDRASDERKTHTIVEAAGAGARTEPASKAVVERHEKLGDTKQAPPPLPVEMPEHLLQKPYRDAERWLEPDTAIKAASASPSDVVSSFYTMHQALGASGIPRGEHIATYRPFFTERLKASMACGARERDRMIAMNPGDKPPFVDDDLFMSNAEGTITWAIGPVERIGSGRDVIAIRFLSRDGAFEFRWEDRIFLRQNQGRWRIDDIYYSVDASNPQGDGQLSEYLTSACIPPEQPSPV